MPSLGRPLFLMKTSMGQYYNSYLNVWYKKCSSRKDKKTVFPYLELQTLTVLC